MKIAVENNAGLRRTYEDVTKWVIDPDGRLHVVGDDGNLASYNAGAWLNVVKG